MATYTVKLNAVKTAMIDMENPGKNYSMDESYTMDDYTLICLGFESIPASYNGKVIRSIEPNLYVTSISKMNSIRGYTFKSHWNETGITYGNEPGTEKLFPANDKLDQEKNWQKFIFTRWGTAKLQDVLTYGLEIQGPNIISGGGFTFFTRQSAYPPYANIQLEDVAFDVSSNSLSPTEGFVGKHIENTFSFMVTPTNEEFVGNIIPSPSHILFRWRPLDGQITEVNLPGNQFQYIVPAETFSSDQIQWQITVVSEETQYTSDWFTLTTVDSISSAKAVSPNNVVVDGSYPVEFHWNHIIDTGSEQTKYELEYSDNNGTSWTPLQSENTSNHFTNVPADTLPAGNLLWRVKTYNTDSVAGEWSEPARFTVRAAPSAPAITSISAEARPLVRWQAVGQQAYEIAVFSEDTLIYTTGETAGTEKSKRIPEYLTSGTYTVKVRVWNTYHIESPWGIGTVQVPESGLNPPHLIITVRNGTAEAQTSGSGYQKFYLLRDGIPIAKSDVGTFTDAAVSAGPHTYTARGVADDDKFADSESQQVTISLPYAMVAPADNLVEWVPLIYRRNSEPSWTENLQNMGQAVIVAGRKKPFFEAAEYWNNILSFAFSYRTLEEYQKLKNLVVSGKTVRYRGKDGAAYWLAITGLQTSTDYMSRDFTMSAQEVDYVERIDYDVEES